eukprot:3571567-Prymnesium_polylepis.1
MERFVLWWGGWDLSLLVHVSHVVAGSAFAPRPLSPPRPLTCALVPPSSVPSRPALSPPPLYAFAPALVPTSRPPVLSPLL